MLEPGRKYSSQSGYRYGFNGQEKDNDVKGDGNSYTAQFWEYDGRISKRWNIDPEFRKFVGESPYLVFHNNPILFNDPNGDTPPKNFKEYKNTVDGKAIFLPTDAKIELYTKKNVGTGNESLIGKIKAFSIGKSRFVNSISKTDNSFSYMNFKNGETYKSPDITIDPNSRLKLSMNVSISVINIGGSAGTQGIQTVETTDTKAPLKSGQSRESFIKGGLNFIGFIDGGINSPFASEKQVGSEAVPGTPYFIGSGPLFNTGHIITNSGSSVLTMADAPGFGVSLGNKITNFQTIIVATNFYGSGQNVVMGVFNWGFKNGAQTHSGINFTDINAQSIKTLLHDYPRYRLNK